MPGRRAGNGLGSEREYAVCQLHAGQGGARDDRQHDYQRDWRERRVNVFLQQRRCRDRCERVPRDGRQQLYPDRQEHQGRRRRPVSRYYPDGQRRNGDENHRWCHWREPTLEAGILHPRRAGGRRLHADGDDAV